MKQVDQSLIYANKSMLVWSASVMSFFLTVEVNDLCCSGLCPTSWQMLATLQPVTIFRVFTAYSDSTDITGFSIVTRPRTKPIYLMITNCLIGGRVPDNRWSTKRVLVSLVTPQTSITVMFHLVYPGKGIVNIIQKNL